MQSHKEKYDEINYPMIFNLTTNKTKSIPLETQTKSQKNQVAIMGIELIINQLVRFNFYLAHNLQFKQHMK